MSTGTGQGDIELRVLALERKVWGPEIDNLQKRLAALEQAKWQGGGGGGATPMLRIMVVTSDIGAMVGAVVGAGMAVDVDFDAGTGGLVAGSGPAETVLNYHEKSFLVGGIITAEQVFSAWWAIDVNACAKYQ